MLRSFIALALCGAACAASAQFSPVEDPDWKENEVPPPPALRTTGLIAVEVPGSSLRFGVDPDSVKIGADGIVRYVVVASSATGVANGMYEGVRCATGMVKVYARHTGNGWVPTREAEWQEIHQIRNSRYSLQIARNGVCLGRGANLSEQQILRDLRRGGDQRFNIN